MNTFTNWTIGAVVALLIAASINLDGPTEHETAVDVQSAVESL